MRFLAFFAFLEDFFIGGDSDSEPDSEPELEELEPASFLFEAFFVFFPAFLFFFFLAFFFGDADLDPDSESDAEEDSDDDEYEDDDSDPCSFLLRFVLKRQAVLFCTDEAIQGNVVRIKENEQNNSYKKNKNRIFTGF